MIFYTDHASEKLATELHKFEITKETITKTINKPDQILYDTQTERYIAIDQEKKTAVIYEKSGEDTLIITIIYSSTLKDVIERRRRSGRWIP